VLWEIGCTAFCIYLLARNMPFMIAVSGTAWDDSARYLCHLSLLVAGLIAYRRSNALRSESAWTNVREETNQPGLLLGEIIATCCITWALCLIPVVFAFVREPSLLNGGAAALGSLATAIVANTILTTGVFFLLSGYVLGTEAVAIVAWTVIVLGFARSDVARELAKGLAFLSPTVGQGMGEAAGIAVRVATPPLEELTKAAMAGNLAGAPIFLAQAGLQAAFVICLSVQIVSRWGAYAWPERRELAKREAGADGSRTES
jgi:hypothetical protein